MARLRRGVDGFAALAMTVGAREAQAKRADSGLA
jgi:hypothetical protein